VNIQDFRKTDLAFAIEALNITVANTVTDLGLDARDVDILEVIGYDLFRAAHEGDTTAVYTHMLRVVRWVYEHDAMTDAMRQRVNDVPANISR
jgi:hypothetical protein